MTTEEGLEHTREGPRQVKRRSRPLIVLGVVLLGLSLAAWRWYTEIPIAEITERPDEPAAKIQGLTNGELLKKMDELIEEGTRLERQNRIAEAEAHQREAAVAAAIVLAGVGVVCIVLGCIPFGFRLMATGILLLGVAAACASFLAAARHIRSEDAAVYGFVIAVTGLSGLVCAALGLVRLLGKRKGA